LNQTSTLFKMQQTWLLAKLKQHADGQMIDLLTEGGNRSQLLAVRIRYCN